MIKRKATKWRAFRPVFLTFWEDFSQAEYRLSDLLILNNKKNKRTHGCAVAGVGRSPLEFIYLIN